MQYLKYKTHQPRVIFDRYNNRHTQLLWDANGNLSTLWMCDEKVTRFHDWDDENRLRMVLDNRRTGYYGYDANGDRVYKLTGRSDMTHLSEELSVATVILDSAVLYPNPFVTITGRGYTKHYYANGERLATSIGAGGFCTMVHDWISLPQTAHEENLLTKWSSIYSNEYPFEYFHEPSPTLTVNAAINGNTPEVIQYGCRMRHLRYLGIKYDFDLLYPVMSNACEAQGEESEIFYTHGDHLGSANWITSYNGKPIQYVHYLPYGQLLANQTPYGYDERYKFTGKERDGETGYDFFGARYFWSLFKHWTSPDPLLDKYPGISPYAYCAWNPVKYVDPDGMWSVSVTASENRGKNPYAMFQVYDNKNNLIYRTIVKVTGKHRDRTKTSGDTPTGKYNILEWRETGNRKKKWYYDPISYGPNDLLALEYVGEEGKGRQGMHVHGGRDQKNLWNTEGCIRIADDDIAELKQLTDMLEAIDPTEHGTTLEVQNNLSGSLQYSRDKEEYKYNLMTDGYLLPEITVTPTY